jgi:hypothetical protein
MEWSNQPPPEETSLLIFLFLIDLSDGQKMPLVSQEFINVLSATEVLVTVNSTTPL